MNINDISQRLQNALDPNYNVLDMPTVLEVVQSLEATRITKEQLETTRLAKHINQLRRNVTLNSNLARRLKNLLKRWREMILSLPLPTSTTPRVTIRQNGGLSTVSSSTTTTPTSTNTAIAPPLTPTTTTTTTTAAATVSSSQPTSFTNFIGQAERAAAATTVKRQPVANHHHHHHNDDRSMSPLPPKMPRCNSHLPSPFDPPPPGMSGSGGGGGGGDLVLFADDSNSRRLFNGSMDAIALTDSNSFPISDNQSSNFVGGRSLGSASAAAVKHKKHKKEKKTRSERKHTAKLTVPASLPTHQQYPNAVAQQATYEPPNSLSSDSNTLFAPASATPAMYTCELTFTGKFAKETNLPPAPQQHKYQNQLPPPSAIISIDSSSNDEELFSARGANEAPMSVASAPPLHRSPIIVQESRSGIRSEENSCDAVTTSMTARTTTISTVQRHQSLSADDSESLAGPEPKKSARKKISNIVNGGTSALTADQHRYEAAGTSRLSPLSGLKTKIELMRGGVKKVKSTHELLAELKNRKADEYVQKLSSPQRRNSSSDSVESTNSTMRSTTATPVSLLVQPESPVDVATVFRRRRRRGRSATGDDENTDFNIDDDDDDTVLKELLAQVQPLDVNAAEMAIAKASTEPFPCTCRIVEIETTVPPPQAISPPTPLVSDEVETADPAAIVQLPTPVIQPVSIVQQQIETPAVASGPIVVKIPIRSIFDLDYDEADDPINSFKDDVAVDLSTKARATTQVVSVPPPIVSDHLKASLEPMAKAVIEEKTFDELQQGVGGVTEDGAQQHAEHNLIPKFAVVEDEECKARQHFDRSNITEFHLMELHNRWVPGVNGNWEDTRDNDIDDSSDRATVTSDETKLYERVVPACNHICEDRIPKNLRHIQFQPKHYDYKRRLQQQSNENDDQVENKTESEMLIDANADGEPTIPNQTYDDDRSSDVVMLEEAVSTDNGTPPLTVPTAAVVPQLEQPKEKGRFNRYKIRKTSSDFAQTDEEKDDTKPTSTKIILKLSRQLTNCSDDEDEDEDDDEDDEEDEEEDNEDEDDGDENDDYEDNDDEGDADAEDELEDVEPYEPEEPQGYGEEDTSESIVEGNNAEANNNRSVQTLMLNNDKVVLLGSKNDDEQGKNVQASERSKEEDQQLEQQSNAIGNYDHERNDEQSANVCRNYQFLPTEDNGQLPSFARATDEDRFTASDGTKSRFREWHQVVHVKSYNDELLTILPYVVID